MPDLITLAYECEELVSKNEMFKTDEYAMQITLKNTINKLEHLITE
jgi:hypothetical protein